MATKILLIWMAIFAVLVFFDDTNAERGKCDFPIIISPFLHGTVVKNLVSLYSVTHA